MIRISSVLYGVLLYLMMSCMGCQLMNGMKLASFPEASVEHPVVEIICVWQPGEGTGMDGLPCRGFAGQILFFAMGEKAPVKVDGKIRIYVFDDQGTEAEQELPIHQFDFDATAFNNFLTSTNMGAAYQLFVPYTRKGTHGATCTLRVRYTPDEGASVYSKMATIILPGTNPRKPDVTIEQAAGVGSRTQVVAELLQPVANAPQAQESQITLAHAQEEAATQDQNKKRLRKTLSEISSIPPSTAEPATGNTGRASLEEQTSSFKLHPLAATTTPSPAAHPLLQEQPTDTPTQQSPAPAESSPATASTKEETATNSSVTESADSPAAAVSKAARHPLLDD